MSANDPPNPDAPQASGSQQPDPSLDWDGDKMFNIYIHDYCEKRGFTKTADALREEAGVEKDGGPPINAKQGLLFEWWSVFWVLFGAKSSGQGSEDALLYTQYQTQKAAANRNEQPIPGPPPHARPPGQLAMPPRQLNGIPRPPGQGAPPMANGVPPGSAMPGQGPQMPNGMHNAYPVQMPPSNGVPANVPGAPPPNGPAMGTPAQQPMVPGQRPGMAPQRGPNGQPFRSPTMAPSPQNPAMPQPGQQPNPMAGPSGPQALNRGPIPLGPHGGQPGMPGGQMAPGQAMAQHHFAQLGTQSQPNSPAASGMTAPSPSMTARQIRPGPNMNQPDTMRQFQDLAVTIGTELMKLDQQKLHELKVEAGIPNKDMPSFTFEEKRRMYESAVRRNWLPSPQKNLGPPGAMVPPSGMPSQMQPPNQRGPMGQQSLTAQGQLNRPPKRSSTSPDENGEQSQSNDSSPPANKRPRKSPDHQQPPMTPMIPITPQGGMPGQPTHGPQSGMMPRQGMSQVPFAGMPMSNQPPMNMPVGPVGPPHMNSHQLLTPQMQQRSPQYRHTMHQLHKSGIPQQGSFNSNIGTGPNASSPATSSDSPYNPDQQQQSRPGTTQFNMPSVPQNRPPIMSQNKIMPMMPPPSPSVAAKNAGGMPQGPGGPGDKNGDASGMNHSPRNAAPAPGQQGQQGQQQGPPGQGGQPNQQGQPGPPGGPSQPGQQQQQQQGPINPSAGANTAPPTPGANGPGSNMLNQNTAPPSQAPQQQSLQMQSTQDMFSSDLMGTGFPEFNIDSSMFGAGDNMLAGLDFSAAELDWFDSGMGDKM